MTELVSTRAWVDQVMKRVWAHGVDSYGAAGRMWLCYPTLSHFSAGRQLLFCVTAWKMVKML